MLVLFHDVTDPASAVAVARCTRLARDGLPMAFEGVDAVGLDLALPPDLDLLARLVDVAPHATAEGVELRRPDVMPPTGLAHVLLAHGEATPQAHDVRLAVYDAFWRDQADITAPDVLVRLATGCGLDGETVRALLADRVALAQRRRQMAAHRRNGIGGVPVVLASRTLLPGLLDEDQLMELAATI